MAEDEYEDDHRTVEEIARDAMKAIADAQRLDDMREEREAKEREDAMKLEVEQQIKKKLKRLEREEEKVEKNNPSKIDTTFNVHWSNPDNKGFKYEGNYNDKYTFRINRGMNLFHLYVEDKKLIDEEWHHKSHTSINLITLKEKADKLLKEFTDKAAAAKKIEDAKKAKILEQKNQNPD